MCGLLRKQMQKRGFSFLFLFFHFRFEFLASSRVQSGSSFSFTSSLYLTHGHVVNHRPKPFLKHRDRRDVNVCLHIISEVGNWLRPPSLVGQIHKKKGPQKKQQSVFFFVFIIFFHLFKTFNYWFTVVWRYDGLDNDGLRTRGCWLQNSISLFYAEKHYGESFVSVLCL